VRLAGPDFVTARSADGVLGELAVALLFAAFESLVVVETEAVLTTEPVVELLTFTTIKNVAFVPAASDGELHVIVPVAPTGGVVHAKAGPPVCDSETNMVFAGTASVSDTVCASEGPLLVTTTVKVAF
jgi:hypothetical protein